MAEPFDDFEARLAVCRPQLSTAERDKLLFQTAQASLKRELRLRTVSYSVLSSILSAAACFGVMTYSVVNRIGESNIAGLRPTAPFQNSVEPRSERNNPVDSNFQLEVEARSRGVLTVASWARWESIGKMELSEASTANEAGLRSDAAESKPLSVSSKMPSY